MDPDGVYEALAKAGIDRNRGLYIAPLLIGASFDFCLMGVMWTQLWAYVMTSRRDSTLNRALVAISTFIATGTSGFTLAYLCHLFAYGFGTYLNFVRWNWINWYALLNVLVTATVSVFYVKRAYQLYKTRWVYVVIAPFMLATLGGAVGAKVVAGSYLTDSTQADFLRPYCYTWLGAGLVMGLLLTGMISCKLAKAKSGDTSDRAINRLILLSVETQLPATLCAIAFMVSYAIEPNSAMNIFFEMFHPKIYVVGMLAVLNSRRAIRKILHPHVQESPESGLPPRFEQQTLSMPTIHYSNGNPSTGSFDLRYSPPSTHQISSTDAKVSQWSSDGETAIGSPTVAYPAFAVVKE